MVLSDVSDGSLFINKHCEVLVSCSKNYRTFCNSKPPVRATIVLPDEVHLGVQRPFSQYRAPTSGAKPCSPPLLENASCCAIPGEYSEQMFNGMDNYICSVTLYLYFKNAK